MRHSFTYCEHHCFEWLPSSDRLCPHVNSSSLEFSNKRKTNNKLSLIVDREHLRVVSVEISPLHQHWCTEGAEFLSCNFEGQLLICFFFWFCLWIYRLEKQSFLVWSKLVLAESFFGLTKFFWVQSEQYEKLVLIIVSEQLHIACFKVLLVYHHWHINGFT